MKQLFSGILDAIRRGENAVLCTVVAASGSTPRGAGAKMAVFADGSIVGTVGGGAVEFQCMQTAREIHGTRVSQVRGFRLRPNEIADIGMICGGDVTVQFQFWDAAQPETAELLRAVLSLLEEHTDSWLVTALRDGAFWSMGTYDAARGLRFTRAIGEAELQPLLRRRPTLTAGEPRYYVEPLGKAGRVYLFGGGHVSQELAPVLRRVDFSVVVCENRAEFARRDLFPDADEVVLAEFSQLLERFSVTEADCLVIMTRGHRDDYLVLRQALRTPAGYVGVIGSRRKAALTLERLRGDGFCEADLARIHTPIGLPIGAETPAEIAVSVAAELIAHRAARAEAD